MPTKAITIVAAIVVGLVLIGGFIALGLLTTRRGSYPDCPEKPAPVPRGPGRQTGDPAYSETGPCPDNKYETDDDGPWKKARLPEDVKPVHYNLWFFPDFYAGGDTFSGTVDIDLNITGNATQYVLVHAHCTLNITNTRVRRKTGPNPVVRIKRAFRYDPYWVVETENPLPEGTGVVLKLKFNGIIRKGDVGMYSSSYTNKKTGKVSYLVSTKFQPNHVSRAFPNFEEADLKATFSVSLRHWANYTAISNMPHKRSANLADGWAETTFDRSPLMTSYLFCFVICDFTYRQTTLANGKPHRIWAQPDRIDEVKFAMRIGTALENYYEQELDMEYHLPKLDQIAIPGYPSSATEHWGIVTYRDSKLLYDPEQSSDKMKEGIATIISHELAHNFFGNPVTYEKWKRGSWLNEGFARFYQDMALEAVLPDWNTMETFYLDQQLFMMHRDGYSSSQPVQTGFSGAAYTKGACILRMIRFSMGEDNFKVAIREYLKKHEFDSVTREDLWEALQVRMEQEFNMTHMSDWVTQPGVPLVTINIREDGKIEATQEAFNNAGNSVKDYTPLPIPLTYVTSNSTSRHMWFTDTNMTFELPHHLKWIKFNMNQIGYYRVDYSTETWLHLAEILKENHEVIPPLDRAGLIDDVFHMSLSGRQNVSVALNLLEYMARETHTYPWVAVQNHLKGLDEILRAHGVVEPWQAFMRYIMSGIIREVGYEDDGMHLTKVLRPKIIKNAYANGDQDCLEKSLAQFRSWLDGEKPLKNLWQTYIKIGMEQNGTEADAAILWQKFHNMTNLWDQMEIITAMGKAPNLQVFEELVRFVIQDNKYRYSLLKAIGKNTVVLEYIWDLVTSDNFTDPRVAYFTDNIDAILPMLGKDYIEPAEEYVNTIQIKYCEYPRTLWERGLKSLKSTSPWGTSVADATKTWLEENGYRGN